MADKQIKQYTENTTPAGADLVIIQQNSDDAYAKVQLSNLVVAGSVKPNSLKSGASSLNDWQWDSWTPSYTGFTLGNGTVNYAKYIRIGNIIFFRFKITLGSTSSVGATAVYVDLPSDFHSDYSINGEHIGKLTVVDSSAGNYFGGELEVQSLSANPSVRLKLYYDSGSYEQVAGNTNTNVKTTLPFTWATGDIIMGSGFYQTTI